MIPVRGEENEAGLCIYRSSADCLHELQAYPAYREYCELIRKTFGEL